MEANLLQSLPSVNMGNAGVALSAIVLEALKEDNYERQSIFMQHYLVAQDLWDVVLLSQISQVQDPKDWIKRNALALHAIKISYGTEAFDVIKKMNSAKDAWDALAGLCKPPNVDGNRESDIEILDNKERTEFVTLLKDIYARDWKAIENLDGITEIFFPDSFTVLHIATIVGHLNIVNELVKIAKEDSMEIQDDNGDTALSLATCKGEVKIAECLVQKNDKSLTIMNNEGYRPLVVACINLQKDMASYLYSITQF